MIHWENVINLHSFHPNDVGLSATPLNESNGYGYNSNSDCFFFCNRLYICMYDVYDYIVTHMICNMHIIVYLHSSNWSSINSLSSC